MTEPQVWVLVGVFAASMFGALTLVVTLINRGTRAAVDGLRGELTGSVDGLRGELTGSVDGLRGELRGLAEAMTAGFAAVDAKFDAVNAKFDAVNTRLDHLDRDVSFLMRREFGITDD